MADRSEQWEQFSWAAISWWAKAAVICGALGGLISITTLSQGADVCSYTDLGALFGAATGGITGLLAILTASRQQPPVIPRTSRIIGLVGIVMAVVNVLRGIGVLAGPC